jgi:hypothetical protein
MYEPSSDVDDMTFGIWLRKSIKKPAVYWKLTSGS